MIDAVISLKQLLRLASRADVAVLGRIPDTRRFTDRERHLDNELLPGVLIYPPESGRLYFNVDHLPGRQTRCNRQRKSARSPSPTDRKEKSWRGVKCGRDKQS